MRILYFSMNYTPHDFRFLSSLAETDHEVFYLKLVHGPRQTEDRPVPSKIKQIQPIGGQGPFALRDIPQLTLNLREVLRKIMPDLVHAGPVQTCAFLAALSGFHPILTMSWGFDLMQDADRNAWWRWATRYTLRRSTIFTSDCEATRQKAIAFGMNPDRTIVFPWGVDLQLFSPAFEQQTLHTSDFTLFCNRSWEPRYGVDVLAYAFIKAVEERPEIQLLLLGCGSQSEIIHQIFERDGVLEHVTFAGIIPYLGMPCYYHKADLFISPSHVDGSSVSLMEAMACGVPCLVSDIPANQEWVADGINGWLFPDGDVEALVAAILRVCDHRKELVKISRAARKTAEEKADWKKNFQKLLEAYRTTIHI